MTFLHVMTRYLSRGRAVSHLKAFRNSICRNSVVCRVNNFKSITTSAVNCEYDADPRTIGRIINKKFAESSLNYIVRISHTGFTMSTGAEFVGPLIMFPHAMLSWHVYTVEQVTEESLCLFKILEPKLDIIVFGYGHYLDWTLEHRQRITNIFKSFGIPFEMLPTDQACGVYNFLAEEGRYVAAALLVPRVVETIKWEKKKEVLIDEIDNDEDDEYVEKLLQAQKQKDKLIE